MLFNIYSFILLFIHPFIYPSCSIFILIFFYSIIHAFILSILYLFYYSFFHSFIYLFIVPLIYLFYILTHLVPFIHLFYSTFHSIWFLTLLFTCAVSELIFLCSVDLSIQPSDLSIYLSIYPYIHLTCIHPSIYQSWSIHSFIYLSSRLSIHVSMNLSIYLFIYHILISYLSVYSMNLSIYSFIYLSIYPSVCFDCFISFCRYSNLFNIRTTLVW